MTNHSSESKDPQIWPCGQNFPRKICKSCWCWLHPQESGQEVFKGPGGVAASLTLLGPILGVKPAELFEMAVDHEVFWVLLGLLPAPNTLVQALTNVINEGKNYAIFHLLWLIFVEHSVLIGVIPCQMNQKNKKSTHHLIFSRNLTSRELFMLIPKT